MTEQEILDKVAGHLLKQNERSVGDDGTWYINRRNEIESLDRLSHIDFAELWHIEDLIDSASQFESWPVARLIHETDFETHIRDSYTASGAFADGYFVAEDINWKHVTKRLVECFHVVHVGDDIYYMEM